MTVSAPSSLLCKLWETVKCSIRWEKKDKMNKIWDLFHGRTFNCGIQVTGKSKRLQSTAPGKEQPLVPADPTTRPALQILAGGFTASVLYRRNHQLDFVNRVIMRTNSYISPTANPFYYRISKTNTWILNFNMNLHFKTLNYPAKRTWMWKKAISSIISLNLKVLIYFNKSRCPYARKLTSKNVKYAQYHLKAYGVLCISKIA